MKARSFVKTVASSGTPEALTQHAVDTMTRSGQVVTVTTSDNHNFATGDLVAHSGANQKDYNNVFKITVTSATVYTFTLDYASTPPVTPATGTIIAIGRLGASRAIVIPGKAVRTANTGTVYVDTVSSNDLQPLALAAVSDQLDLFPPPGTGNHFALSDWFVDVATNGDGVVVIYWPQALIQ